MSIVPAIYSGTMLDPILSITMIHSCLVDYCSKHLSKLYSIEDIIIYPNKCTSIFLYSVFLCKKR